MHERQLAGQVAQNVSTTESKEQKLQEAMDMFRQFHFILGTLGQYYSSNAWQPHIHPER